MTMEPISERPRRVFFRAVLSPYRSLSPKGFRTIMLSVCAASLTIGTGLYLAGAWPVFGFLGLDVLLVYLALKASFRSARISETLELDERALTVDRVGLRGDRAHWSLQPNWLRVDLAEPVMPDTPLLLRTHGQSLAIAAFVGPDQRRAVARDLASALEDWRTAGPEVY
ncbi:MAG TPA: DUF2244 domain-containing protein [Alphaproteobacteria bacterium]|nr:DUF2244 domain-containing protein [Alphaproteobacteria bacterium]